jgi:SAM-dependent methyltransferase
VPRAHRRGEYGVDAPTVPAVFVAAGIATLALAAVGALLVHSVAMTVICAILSAYLLLGAASYLYTTRAGKFAVWARLIGELPLRGDERVLDLGCGRGAVLLLVAQALPAGTAVGVDLWKTGDQSGNAPDVTRRNAVAEGVADRVELQTADMRELPFADASFDLVVSSLAIHNIHAPDGRERAIDEAVRVLKPGGRLLIADILATADYAARLRERGMADVALRGLGWRFWYGGPWMPTRLVRATKPA